MKSLEINFRNPLIGANASILCVQKHCAPQLMHSLELCASRITICASWTQWRALDKTLHVQYDMFWNTGITKLLWIDSLILTAIEIFFLVMLNTVPD